MRIRVRSLFAKIFLWFTATIVLSWAGIVTTSFLLLARLEPRESATRVHSLFVDDARRAFEEGGPPQLSEYLARLDTFSEAQHYLVDVKGIDLVDGTDRSGLLALRASRQRSRSRVRSSLAWWGLPWFLRTSTREGPQVLVHASERKYRLITVLPARRRIGASDPLVYFLWLPILIGGLCYLLAVHIASPLRGLRRTLETFGRGDLSVRYHVSRRDEIGELARTFNRMADQIETLLSAERRLLQDVSHELRSPLARLGFAVELARSSPDRETALARIRKEADRLNHLVDELLQLTRAEGDPTARNMEDVDLGQLLHELVADCLLEADAAGCRLTLVGEPTLVITGDPELLRRACENVVRNAVRHAPKGTSVVVELARQGDRAEVTVRDHGSGVPHETLSAIFEPFFRVETDRGRDSGGIGLGLAIARRAVELHHGRVTAFNADPGLVVAIDLPCGEPMDDHASG